MTREILFVVVAIGVAARGAPAQTGRDALAAGIRAHDVADFQTAAGLLSRGLDPEAGALDSLWVLGVHNLVDALNETDHAALAETWVRWALRQLPDMVVDTIAFPPAVKRVVQAAREAVDRTAGDTATVRLRWIWSRDAGSGDRGALRLREGEIAVTAQVEDGAFLAGAVDRVLAPGSHTIVATAQGRVPARVTVEVLPGVTTVLDFQLAHAPPGTLYVDARPWAEVFLDNESVGYTLLVAHPVQAGRHQLRLVRDGYAPFDTTIAVSAGEPVRLGTVLLKRRSP
ncbi:MAG TPA: PEGA domain-containing protein [Gemmatimonadales bacterium]